MNGESYEAAPPAMGVSVGTALPAMGASNGTNLQATGDLYGAAPPMTDIFHEAAPPMLGVSHSGTTTPSTMGASYGTNKILEQRSRTSEKSSIERSAVSNQQLIIHREGQIMMDVQ